MLKTGLCASAATAALLLGGVAQAQTTPQNSTAATQTSRLEEVVVTAQKRAENVQSTPLAVTAVGAQALRDRNVVQPQDLANIIPSLRVVNSSIGYNISLRGIGTSNSGPIGSGAVAIHIDGAYQAMSPTSGIFFDVDRVELVAGPQGTLYGRGATGGSLNIITKKPVNRFEGEGELEVGNYGETRVYGMVNAPITDSLYLRAAVQSIKHDGYYSDGYFDQDEQAGRLQLLWKPTDRFSLLLEGGADVSDALGATQVKAPVQGDPFKAGAQPPNTQEHIQRRFFTAQGDYDLGFATLTYLGNYQDSPQDQFHWHNQGGDSDSLQSTTQQSHELRLTSPANQRLTYVVGLFYLDEDQGLFQHNYQSAGFVNEPAISNKSAAAFGQGTFKVTDRLRITGGIRYTEDKVKLTGRLYTTTGIDTGFFTTRADYNNTSYKAGVEYDLGARSLLYANFGTGYRPGGVNQGAPPDNTYNPETVTHYEIGSKNRFFDNRLQLNGDVYYDDYKNYFQGSAVVVNPIPAGLRGFQVVNAGEATIYGAEVNLGYVLGDHDRFNANVNYLHARFDSFLAGGINYAGQVLPNAPEWNASLNYTHDWDMPGGGKLAARADMFLSTSFLLDYRNLANQTQDSFERSNLDLTYTAPSDRWSASLFVKNLEDRRVLNYAYLFMNNVWQAYDPPRTFGMKIGARF